MGIPPAPKVQAGKNLYDRLQLERMQMDLARRITDLTKTLREVKEELDVRTIHAVQVQRLCLVEPPPPRVVFFRCFSCVLTHTTRNSW